jgi:hypothetical protein
VIERSTIVAAKMAFVEHAAPRPFRADVICHIENENPPRV